MRGRIYSDQKCDMCGRKFVQDEKRRGLFCSIHSNQQATKRFTVRFGRQVQKRFNNYPEAERFLDALRYEVDQGTFDHREYLAQSPLSFTVLSNQYLDKKKNSLSPGTYQHYQRYISVAQNYFKETSVKKIQYAQLEDFADSLNVSNKTRANYLDCIRAFYKWLVKRQEISRNEEPEFPKISFQLGYRNTVDKETQISIIDEVERISYHVSPKIWLGIKWLATYISIRPQELLDLKEGHIDLKQGFFFIPHPKAKRPKIVPLIPEDVEILRQLPKGLPDLYFFRH